MSATKNIGLKCHKNIVRQDIGVNFNNVLTKILRQDIGAKMSEETATKRL